MNRLQNEKSPYLLQHAGNPVDWFPWGDEAFRKAEKENKPVFLSVGYATCHWCHVMEHESFEDEEVAALMNNTFVSIKVDREERPDIDHTYMTICQMLTGQGGWPLTILMTPRKEPFYAATYIPKRSRPNRLGMLDLVPGIDDAWKNKQDRIIETIDQIKDGFSKSLELGRSSGSLPETILREAEDSLSRRFDPEHGGFGTAPKFPSAHNLLFLADLYRREKSPGTLRMIELTLEKMRLGGLWDHVGKGFHRYSTDREWLLPHFEKMLYDQAMLLMAYAEGWKLTKNPLYKETAYDIVRYADECLTSPEGAFFSAEDADSEGEEGKFYVWEKSDIESLLSGDDAGLFCRLYDIETDGNFHDEATRQKTGANIPYLTEPVPDDLKDRTGNILEQLHRQRQNRVRPLLDDKILTDWNGLMIAALARAGALLDDTSLTVRAENAWKVISEKCMADNNRLLHRLKDGDAAIEGMADDYAFTIWGLLELYDATYRPEYLRQAAELQQRFDREFYDDRHGGYFFTASGAEPLLGRQKEIYDGALPSSNSAAALNGFRLFRLTGHSGRETRSASVFRVFSDMIGDAPAGYTFALKAFRMMNTDTNETVICAPGGYPRLQEVIRLCREHTPPGSSILLKTPETEKQLDQVSEFTRHYPVDDNLAVYVCYGFACKAPVHSPEELQKMLQALPGSSGNGNSEVDSD